MKTTVVLIFAISFTVFSSFSIAKTPPAKDTTGVPSKEKIERGLNLSPLVFQENKGQWQQDIIYQAKNNGINVRFLKNGISFCNVNYINEKPDPKTMVLDTAASHQKESYDAIVWNLDFPGSNPNVLPVGGQKATPHYSYFKGNDHSKWCKDVCSYENVFYNNLYNNIDLKYYSNSGKELEYDVMVKPGGNIADMKFRLSGVKGLHIAEDGELIISTAHGDVKEGKPYAYQNINNTKTEVPTTFVLISDTTFGFKVNGNYNAAYELVIDPLTLSWVAGLYANSSQAYSSYDDWINGIDIDNDGNIYVTGRANTPDFPIDAGYSSSINQGLGWNQSGDIFVSKLNKTTGALEASTFIGGEYDDWGSDIKFNPNNGYIYVIGSTGSLYTCFNTDPDDADFPINHISPFVTPFQSVPDINGVIPLSPCDYAGSGVSIISSAAVIAVFNNTLDQLEYSSYLGNFDFPTDIEFDQSGLSNNIYVAGYYDYSGIWPVASSADSIFFGDYGSDVNFDGFVCQISADGGNLLDVAQIGGSVSDDNPDVDHTSSIITAMQVNNGNAFITGYTTAGIYDEDKNPTGFPHTSSAYTNSSNSSFLYGYNTDDDESQTQSDVFVAEINFSGSSITLPYSTVIGSTSDDEAYDMFMNTSGTVYITGYTSSYGQNSDLITKYFPTTSGAYSRSPVLGLTPQVDPFSTTENPLPDYYEDKDIFVMELNTSLSTSAQLKYSTYIGGTGNDAGYNITLDNQTPQHIWVGGLTNSSNFPNSCNSSYVSPYNDFILFELDPTKSGSNQLLYTTFLGGSTGSEEFGGGEALQSYNFSYNVNSICPEGDFYHADEYDPNPDFFQNGVFFFGTPSLKFDGSTNSFYTACNTLAQEDVGISYSTPENNFPLSIGGPINLNNNGGYGENYYEFAPGGYNATIFNSICTIETYVVNQVTVPPSTICSGSCATLTATLTPTCSDCGYVYTWSPSTGLTTTTGSSISACPTVTTTYTVTVTNGDGCLIGTASATVTVDQAPAFTISGDPDDCTLTGSSGSTPPVNTYTIVQSPATSNTFNWTLTGNGVFQSSGTTTATGTTNVINWSDLMGGSIKVTETDANGCTLIVYFTVYPCCNTVYGTDQTLADFPGGTIEDLYNFCQDNPVLENDDVIFPYGTGYYIDLSNLSNGNVALGIFNTLYIDVTTYIYDFGTPDVINKLYFGPLANIDVKNDLNTPGGVTLGLGIDAYLDDACNFMWNGIHVENSNRLVTLNDQEVTGPPVNVKIADADTGIYIYYPNGISGQEATFGIWGITFLNDKIGMLLVGPGNYTTKNSSIIFSNFNTENNYLIPPQPANSITNDGIVAIGVSGINIGWNETGPENFFGYDPNYSGTTYGITTGISINYSTANIYNNLFENCTNAGILAEGATVKVAGLGYSVSVPANVNETWVNDPDYPDNFVNCKTGIQTYGAVNGSFTNNFMTATAQNSKTGWYGVYCSGDNNTGLHISPYNLTVSNNSITNYNTGIALYDNTYTQISVSGNTINLPHVSTQPLSSLPDIVGILSEDVGIGASKPGISCNYIYPWTYGTGISLSGEDASTVANDNSIYLNGTLSSFATAYGVKVVNCTNSNLISNIVIGSSTYGTLNSRIAYYTTNSMGCQLNSNSSDYTYTGFKFFGNCGETVFQLNAMNHSYAGLDILSTASNNLSFMGNQGSSSATNGNQWLGSFTGYGSNSNYQLRTTPPFSSNFYVNSGYPNSPSVNYIDGNPSMQFNTISASNPSTPAIFCTAPPPSPGGKFFTLDDFYREVAEDSIPDSSFSGLSIYQSQKYLYTQLQDDKELLDTNAIYRAFYDSMSATVIGDFAAVEDSIKSLLNMSAVNVIDSITYSNPTGDSTISDNSAGVGPQGSYLAVASTGEISPPSGSAAGVELNIYLCSSGSPSYSTTLANAIAANAAIPATTVYETNEQGVNDIYLKTLISGIDTFTTNQFDSLLYIAYQCPYIGGNAVYDARALVHFVDDTIIFNDDSLCATDSIEQAKMRLPKQSSTVSSFVSLYPNPANSSVTVSYSLGNNTQGTLLIYNEIGQDMMSISIGATQGTFNINTSAFSQGIYFYKLVAGNSNVGIGKLAIIKP